MALKIGLIVPVYKNFPGFAEMIESVDEPVVPIIIANWRNNKGVSVAWNIGIEAATIRGCDLALICNDDIVLHPETIWKLRTAVWDFGYDLVTPVNTRHTVPTDYPEYRPTPDYSCFMIKPQEFRQKFGNFDEHFSPAYFEDNDMAYRMQLLGGKGVCRTDAGFFHKGSVTQNWGGQPVVTPDMFLKNKAYYISKWGDEPGRELFVTPFNRVDVAANNW